MDKKTAIEIYDILDKHIENPQSELNYSSTYELLIAVILSAQCTDKRVNQVTAELFKHYNKPEHFATMPQSQLEKLIFSTGFFRNKAKNIIAASQKILSDYHGQVPNNLNDLMSLPGVGKKTANVILIVGFDTPAIPVDTHVFRVSNRIGLVKAKNVVATESQLEKLYSKEYYAKLHHLLILHGRYTCVARKPKCDICPIKNYCEYYKEIVAKQ